MGIGSIGSSPSFWQQDQNYWQQAQQNDNTVAASDSIINAMSSAETNLGKGLASIANQTALDRVNSQLTAAIQSVLSGNSSGSSGTSGSSSTTSSSATSNSSPSPATGTGTASLTLSTPLSILGIPTGAKIAVTAGGNTTTYTSTGTDTVGDLLTALNANDYGNAQITASLNQGGRLVLTSKNTTDIITVGGLYAGNIGFGVNNDSFTPTQPSGSNASGASSSSASSTSSTSSTSASTSKPSSSQSYTTLGYETASSAASLLSDSGVGGTLVNMLA